MATDCSLDDDISCDSAHTAKPMAASGMPVLTQRREP
jgi:hypothetical protein